GCQTEKKHHSSTPRSLSRAPSVKQWSQLLPGSRRSKRAERYSRLGCLALAAQVRRPPQDTPHPHWARSEAGSARQLLQRRCPLSEAGRDTPSALQLSLQHSSSQLRALPRAQPRPRDSTPLAAGGAEVSLMLPDGDSYPVATQGGAVEPTPPPQKSARRSHENHVQHGKQVLTSTTLICPNS